MSEIEKIKQELKSLQERLDKLEQTEQDGQWEPEYGEMHYLLTSAGIADVDKWLDTELDKDRLLVGNVFRTNEKAKFEEEKLKVIKELKQYSREFIHGENNWHVCYNFNHDDIFYDYNRVIKRTTLYFDSENIVRQAVQEVGEDRVKKYYLEVE